MPGQAGSGADHTCRILNPLNALIRLRPVLFESIGQAIHPHHRRIEALQLFFKFYPELMWDNLPVDDWTDILRYFLFQVQDDRQIRMDWASMDDLYRYAIEDYLETEEEKKDPDWEPEGLEILAMAMKFIPVECFGFDNEGFRGLQIEEYPVMRLLDALLNPGGHELPGSARFYFLDDLGDWDEWNKIEALERIRSLDMNHLPEPLHWLPEMAAYAIAGTGNELLDNPADFNNWDIGWFTWDELDTVCNLYRDAETTHERMELFNAWADSDVIRLIDITELVTGRKL